MPWQEHLNREKLVAVVLYLLRGCRATRPGLTALVKMIWYADYWHYRRELRTITGARYVALPQGPVLDDYRDLFAALEEEGVLNRRTVPVQGQPNPKEEYLAQMEPNEDLLSENEAQILDDVVRRLGHLSGSTLSRMSHSEAPWLLAWNPIAPGGHIPYVAFRWPDNLPDDEDRDAAGALIEARPAIRDRIAELNQMIAR